MSARRHLRHYRAHRRAETGESQVGDLLYAGIERAGKARTAAACAGARTGSFSKRPAWASTKRAGCARCPARSARTSECADTRSLAIAACTPAGFPRAVRYADRFGDRGHGGRARVGRADAAFAVRVEPWRRLADTGYCHMSRMAVRKRATGGARAGDRLCRLDWAVDRAAPALRSVSQRPSHQSATVKFVTRAQLGRRELARFREALGRLKKVSRARRWRRYRARTGEARKQSRCARSTRWTSRWQRARCCGQRATVATDARFRHSRSYGCPLSRNPHASHPQHRWSRALYRETVLTPADLIWPLFVTEGKNVADPIDCCPAYRAGRSMGSWRAGKRP